MKSADVNISKKPVLSSGNTWAELYNILYDLLERRQYLLPYAKEFTLIDDTLKSYFSGVPSCSIGEYKVYGHCKEVETCSLPANLKNKYAKKDKRWVVEIQKQNKK